MREVCEKERCTGCGACVAICAHKAVTMSEGRLGARYSTIDAECCVDCGLCRNVCPVTSPVELSSMGMAYAVYAKSKDERASAASGGAASVLSRSMIASGGVVYGCAIDEDLVPRHVRVDAFEGLDRLKGSKYVQSDTADVFKKVKTDLQNGIEVLFVGTPCQVAALKNFISLIPALESRLYTIDLCCHGTPSQNMLNDHLDYLGVKSMATKLSFREKTGKKIRYRLSLSDASGSVLYDKETVKDHYMTGFLSGMFLRENCFSCSYAVSQRCSDVTLADFWSIGESENPEMKVSKGLSTVLVNTEKGRRLFERAADAITYEERPLSEALKNGQFRRPAEKPDEYDIFAECYDERGYVESCRKFLPACQRRILVQQLKTLYYKWPFRQYLRKLLKK